MTVDVRRGAELLDATGIHHRDAVRQRERFGLRVGDEDEGDADVALQGDELALHGRAQLVVERTEGFVEQQQARLADQAARQRHALLLPPGQLVRVGVRLVGEVHRVEHVHNTSSRFGSRRLCHPEWKADVVGDRQVRKQCIALEHRVQWALLRWRVAEVAAVEQDFAAIGQVEAGNHAQDGGFAAAGGAKEGEELSLLDGKADVVDRGNFAEAARQVAQFQQGHGRTVSGFTARRVAAR